KAQATVDFSTRFHDATWSHYNNATGSWYGKVEISANDVPTLILATTDETVNPIGYATKENAKRPWLQAGYVYEISIPDEYIITGYEIKTQSTTANNKSEFKYTTANGLQESETQETSNKTINVEGLRTLKSNVITLDMSEYSKNGTHGILLYNLTVTYCKRQYIKAVVDGFDTETNPNTHFGGIKLTCGETVQNITLKTEHLEANDFSIDISKSISLEYARKYRGFNFVGFSIDGTELGQTPTLTDEQKNKLADGTPLVVKFATDGTDDVTLFYDDAPKSYRIPAIATTGTGRIIAISDYRHNLDDIGRDNHKTGTLRIDLVARMSDNNGATWNDTHTIAQGDNSKVGSYERAFGDAAIATYGDTILVMAAAGDQLYPYASATSINRMARIFSIDNGVTWSHEEMSTKMYSTEQSLIPSGVAAFFGSGKLAVDPNYNGTEKPRIYGALLIKNSSRGDNNYVVYTDDFGVTWNILGGSQNPIAYADEPKVEILPNGQILLSARRQGGRVFNIFTYSDKATNVGAWSSAVNGCDNGGKNGTNGEIMCVDAKKIDGTAVKLLLQSQPKGGTGHYDRRDVTIWYKEISADVIYTPADIANNWIEGKQISEVLSSYSTMSLQNDGKIAFFFEEAPCYGDDYTKGYSMVYIPLTVEEITNSNYYGVISELPEINEVHVVLTDANGNEYNEVLDATSIAETETKLKNKYPYITLGTSGNIVQNDGTFTYTNTVVLPFTVSNENATVWHNIYWPANTNENGYPVYLSASSVEDQYVPKVTEGNIYGNSSYNTLNNNDKISWAIYSVDKGFAFTFKNKVTGKYIKATGVASGNAQNVIYVDESDATAFAIVEKTGSYKGDYALAAEVNGNTGYLCSTSATGYHYATHYSGNGHQGAWVKFATVDYEGIIAKINDVLASVNCGIYTLATSKVPVYNTIKSALANSGNVKLSALNNYLEQTQTLFDGATLNAPKTGYYYRIAYDYGTNVGELYMQGVATEQFKNGQNSYAVKFDNAKGAESIWYYDGGLMSYTAGKYIKEHGNDRGLQAIGAKQNATFSVSNRNSSKFCINLGSYLHANVTGVNYYSDHCSGNNCAEHDFTVIAVASLPVEITEAGYATFFAPVAVIVPAGVIAYTATVDGEWVILNEIEGGVIPANTGVVLQGVEGIYNFAITTTDATVENNDLCGSAAATYYTTAGTYYALGLVDGEVGFYRDEFKNDR
ncbi:MAG: exo-alpha-sialidase, partial [Bacteroidaceae bacterium]|nr:exo-alpha-sialidase [Bacteroidaceae bacterium]